MVHQLRASLLIMALRIADCGLRIADCALRIADCGLRIADCGLRIGFRIRARAGLGILVAAIVAALAASIARAETPRPDLRIRAYLDQRFAAAADRRNAMVDELMAGLRRRGDVIDLYLPAGR